MKLIIQKIIILSALSVFLVNQVYAQTSHELSVAGGGGMSKLNYKTDLGKSSYGLHRLFGLGYSFFFNPNWGVNTGLECSFYSSHIRVQSFHAAQIGISDSEGDAFDFHSAVSNYKEKQHVTMLNIPLMLQYQTSGKYKFYVAAGGKISLPIHSRFSGSEAVFTNKGYYPKQDNWLETQEFAGFGTFTCLKTTDKLLLRTTITTSLEAGMKWRLCDRTSLYSGLYIDYGFSDIIRKSGKESFMKYNQKNPSDFSHHSILNATYYQDQKQVPFTTSKITPLALGIKLRYAFSL